MEVTFSPAIENKAETKDRNGPISPEEILYSSFIIIVSLNTDILRCAILLLAT